MCPPWLGKNLKRALSNCLRMALQRCSKLCRKKEASLEREVLRQAIKFRHLILLRVYHNKFISKYQYFFISFGIHIENDAIIPRWLEYKQSFKLYIPTYITIHSNTLISTSPGDSDAIFNDFIQPYQFRVFSICSIFSKITNSFLKKLFM